MVSELPLAAGATVMILSPHLDDAVLSCGALMMDAHRRGARVVVVTVFNGRPSPPLSAAAVRFHQRCGHTGADAMRRREEEDTRALGVLQAHTVRLHLPEALYRKCPDGTSIYAEDSAIFVSAIPPADAALGDVMDSIAGQVQAWRPDVVLAPAGIGGHVDHLLVASAATQLGCAVLHFEDVPYVTYDRCRGWMPDSRCGAAYLHYGTDEGWHAKTRAIECYASQRDVLWYSPGTWREDLDAYALTAGGGRRAERFWGLDGT
jgi:LmbE family N-acetylglucosaminyl deacetylase